ncbi:RNA polymerase sigma factor [Rasiella rasia]|uniref:RNA polymerase sigma factor n=1 Tax=Rasiella rasia TaxID=2744027 RepID=A0A6G6GSA4_9FLAO|nr:RNA polymerase sigma factor [Rasiella rasia]QIE60591.1 RNA polymerase sigma factor [Rasiella rasia]
MSSNLLVAQCKQNSRKAQLALYKQYCDGMFVVALRYMKDDAAAQDAVQEAFIKAFKKIEQFKGDVTFGAWLKRIVINTCLDALKARKLETEPLYDETLRLADDESDWQVSDDRTVEEVMDAIEKLSDNYRDVAKLFLLEGYDHQEIAGIMGITESASRTKLHRGKLQLKEHLKHLQYGTGY